LGAGVDTMNADLHCRSVGRRRPARCKQLARYSQSRILPDSLPIGKAEYADWIDALLAPASAG
jgi:hypothetical protein